MTVHNINSFCLQYVYCFPKVEEEGGVGDHVLLVVMKIQIVNLEPMVVNFTYESVLVVIVFVSDHD